MNRTTWAAILLAFLALTLGLAGCGAIPTPEPEPPAVTATATQAGETPASQPRPATETVILLHTNDFHGAIEPEVSGGGESGGLVNLVSLIDQLRAQDPERTLVLDAGDTFQGTYISNVNQGQVVMAAMNLAGYDAWALGNHEFDWGQDPLRDRIAQAEFPALAANLRDGASGQAWAGVAPYTILQAGHARVAVLGLTYPDTPVINKPQNVAGLEFLGAQEAVRGYLPELEEQADLIVVLSHAGYDNDLALAKAVEGIDVIVGGHSHKFIERPYQIGDTLIVQAGAKGQVLGRLELTVDLETGRVVDHDSREVLQRVNGTASPKNEAVQALVDAALAEAAGTMDQPVGEMALALEPSRAGEFALGNLVTDAMLGADMGDGRPAEIAFHNNGGIRAGLPRGPVTYGQVYAVLPFDNQLLALDLTGAQVLEILDRSVADSAGRLQVAGLTFRFNSSKPRGQRVLEAFVGGQPLDPARVYRVVTIDYLAAGGDGYDTFLEGENVAYGDGEAQVVADYIGAHSPVEAQVEGRIEGR